MKQTVTANISGMVFHIEVDAYEILQSYLGKIRSYFKNSGDCDEIMADIESRIAELMNDKLDQKNQVITLKDVEEVIQIMGKPEQYVTDESEESAAGSASEKTTYSKETKRLFRDPDNRVFGGVASGIGHYVGLDPVWIRLLFVIIFFVGSSGFWIYIILWIVMPEAKTAAQKLQMKGEPVNIENIGKTFEEGAKRMSEEFKNLKSRNFGEKLENFFEKVFGFLAVIIKGTLKVLARILGLIIVVTGIFLVFVLFGLIGGETTFYAASSAGIFSFESTELLLTFFNSASQYQWARYAVMGLVGIPLIALVYGGLKLLFNFRGHGFIGAILGIVWTLCLFVSAYIALQVGSEFKSEATHTEFINIRSDYSEYVLEMSDEVVPGSELITTENNDFLLHIDKSNIYYGIPLLDIDRSFSDSIKLKVHKTAYGSTKKESTDNATEIDYSVEQNGELLSFDSFIRYSRENKIRGQEVQLTLLIPLGKTIYLDESLKEMMYDVDNVTDTWDEDMLGNKWVMLESGLTCLDCPEIEGITSEELNAMTFK